MILIKTYTSKINDLDQVVKDESGWNNIDLLTSPIRSAGFRGTGEIKVEDIKRQINAKIKLKETEGHFKYPPTIHHNGKRDEYPFLVLWKYAEEDHHQSNPDSEESP